MSIEYHCEGCGYGVVDFSLCELPRHQFCAVCRWLDEHESPERLMQIRRRCEPGGWETERQRRGLAPLAD